MNVKELKRQAKNALTTSEPIKAMTQQMLNMMIAAEFESLIGATKYERTNERKQLACASGHKAYRMGTRTRRFDTRAGTLTLTIPRPIRGGYVPSFLPRYSRYEATLKRTIVEAYANGVSTCKMSRLLNEMGIEGISATTVSRITSEANKIAESFRRRSLHDTYYPILFVDATWQKIKTQKNLIPIVIVMGLDAATRKQDVLAIEAYDDESTKSYTDLLTKLKQRGLQCPKLIISDSAAGIKNAIRDIMPETKWQLCQAHFARSVTQKLKSDDAKKLIGNEIVKMWRMTSYERAADRAVEIYERYKDVYPAAMRAFRFDVMNTLTFLNFKDIPSRLITTSNRVERLNLELRRRAKLVGTFANVESCLRLNTLVCIGYISKVGIYAPSETRS